VEDWIKIFVLKDADYNISKIDAKAYDGIFERSVQEYATIIGTNSEDLKEFHKAGGKLMSYHGLADPVIPSKNSRRYFNRVRAFDKNVSDYFRHYEAPGVGHCYSGTGIYPSDIFKSLVDWVEHRKTPDKLIVDMSTFLGGQRARILCPYPQRSLYRGTGNVWKAESYFCQ